MYYHPGDHFANIEAIISYNTTSQEYISYGIDCDQEVTYSLTTTDKEFLSSEIDKRVKKKEVSLSFIQSSPDSEIMFSHIKVRDYHFFLVLKSDNFSEVQLQLNDIVTYFNTSFGTVSPSSDEDMRKIQNDILFNFQVNQSSTSELCDKCKAQGMCAPKYLKNLFTKIP